MSWVACRPALPRNSQALRVSCFSRNSRITVSIHFGSLKKSCSEKHGLIEIIVNTSPLQYRHQTGLLHILPPLSRAVVVPPGVVDELQVGRKHGIDVPDLTAATWIEIRQPASTVALE